MGIYLGPTAPQFHGYFEGHIIEVFLAFQGAVAIRCPSWILECGSDTNPMYSMYAVILTGS